MHKWNAESRENVERAGEIEIHKVQQGKEIDGVRARAHRAQWRRSDWREREWIEQSNKTISSHVLQVVKSSKSRCTRDRNISRSLLFSDIISFPPSSTAALSHCNDMHIKFYENHITTKLSYFWHFLFFFPPLLVAFVCAHASDQNIRRKSRTLILYPLMLIPLQSVRIEKYWRNAILIPVRQHYALHAENAQNYHTTDWGDYSRTPISNAIA